MGWGDTELDREFEGDGRGVGAGAEEGDGVVRGGSSQIGVRSCQVLFLYTVKEEVLVEFD